MLMTLQSNQGAGLSGTTYAPTTRAALNKERRRLIRRGRRLRLSGGLGRSASQKRAERAQWLAAFTGITNNYIKDALDNIDAGRPPTSLPDPTSQSGGTENFNLDSALSDLSGAILDLPGKQEQLTRYDAPAASQAKPAAKPAAKAGITAALPYIGIALMLFRS